MSLARKGALTLAAALIGLVLVALVFHQYVRGAAFVIQASGMQGVARTVADWDRTSFTEQSIRIPWRNGELPGRRYLPAHATGRPILLVPGVHASGIEEPRLIGFARDIASTGHPVVTAGLEDLAQYSVTARSTDMIEDAAAWLVRQTDLATDGRIGMLGISFAGGLSIVAAGRPSLLDRVAFVLSFGGHGDLPRTLRYLCTGVQADGKTRPPHDYGVAIITLGVADRIVPADQVQPLRDTILAFLEASRLDLIDKARAQQEFARAKTMAAALPQPSQSLMTYINDRDVARLGPILLPHVAELGGNPALSPSRSSPPSCPIFLLHGTDDNVIPAIESVLLAQDLRSRGVVVHQLATPLITHAEVDRSAAVSAMWNLVKFWGDVLAL
jgi:dienelactone hydrolase